MCGKMNWGPLGEAFISVYPDPAGEYSRANFTPQVSKSRAGGPGTQHQVSDGEPRRDKLLTLENHKET